MSVNTSGGLSHVVISRSKQRRFRRSQDWRWRFVSSNGHTLASSGEGYANLGDLYAALAVVLGVEDMAVQDPEGLLHFGYAMVSITRKDGRGVWVNTCG